jgi:branched-chain amino acid transport system ATP-binding protein
VGKTTVMKTIAGWVAPTQGTVRFEGQPIGGMASERICRQGIGFVPEDRRIVPGPTVEENLVLGFMQSPGRSRAEHRRRLDATYARFPRLGGRRLQMGTTLSGGEQQMLAMARVLVGQPRLLLIDEPTEGLAPKIVDEIFMLMDSLRRDGIPILLVEQNMHRAFGLVQRFYGLERGAVVMSGDGTKAADREALMRKLAV